MYNVHKMSVRLKEIQRYKVPLTHDTLLKLLIIIYCIRQTKTESKLYIVILMMNIITIFHGL